MGLGPDIHTAPAAGPRKARRLFVYNGGFLTQKRLRRILQLSGYSLHLGTPKDGDAVAVWGASPTAKRGHAVAQKYNVPVVTFEDAFLRSLLPGRAGEPPIGLVIDERGPHFDPAQPSDLEVMLSEHPLDDAAMLARARGCIERLKEAHLTKYAAVLPDAPLPEPGYVVVVDQTRDDASVTASGADRARFQEMLVYARQEHPKARILIKTHPETVHGFRSGHFTQDDCTGQVSLFDAPVSPWALLEGAIAVYTVSSQFGFEAILMGHRPRLFGQPFYAGWGLSDDQFEVQRRQRMLTRTQLFMAAMILYPKWYDPYRDTLCPLENVIDTLEATARCWREDHRGWVASGMSLWKRKPLQRFFGSHKPVKFIEDPVTARQTGQPWMVWAGKATVGQNDAARVEDGFLRSRGLGAKLVPPLSLVVDDLGIYYDPQRPSRLEKWIEARASLRPDQQLRAERLIKQIRDSGLSKYNLRGTLPVHLPSGHRILVPGQVADDASIMTGTGNVADNLALLQATRDANPDAVILYKPHPDVEAGLRDGKIDASGLADVIVEGADPISFLGQVDEVWTMTSLLGFEALLRGVSVTTLGTPFYAGWGLTQDLGDIPPRRKSTLTLEGLVHAALIDYPRYLDPKTGGPCPVEVIVDRLQVGDIPQAGMANRILSKMQGIFASQRHLWRR